MGANLARNAARNGAKVAVYNRTSEKTDEFIREYGSEGDFVACKTLKELVDSLESPRPILIMVKAGKAVDAVIDELAPLLLKEDIIIDGGNSHFPDTDRRTEELKKKKIRFIEMGVSGGEEGALNGPSMMPGGDKSAYEELKPLLLKMAADDGDGGKCVTYIGDNGAGHFVKMVHNGIEYAIMQLIAESYDVLKSEGGKSNAELADIFSAWNEGEDLNSFLIEITAKIFAKKEEGKDVIDLIKDAAGQKGTGKWTTEAALDFGVAIPTINAAVDARIISGSEGDRMRAGEFPETLEQPYSKPEKLTSRVRIALELSVICAYMQGFSLMESVSKDKKWNLDFSDIARIWRGGCIIRSAFLKKMEAVYTKKGSEAKKEILTRFDGESQLDWRRVVSIGTGRGIPLPAMSSALSYYDSLRREHLPQNLIQAQRDFFGAHTYERLDKKGTFHTQW